MKKLFLFLAIGSFLFANDLSISNARVVESIPGSKNTAVFLDIKNTSKKPIFLVKATNSIGAVSELHTHIHENGIMTMKQVEKLEIPAKAILSLKPGGHHIMLMNLVKPLKKGIDLVDLNLEFSDGSVIKIKDIEVVERK